MKAIVIWFLTVLHFSFCSCFALDISEQSITDTVRANEWMQQARELAEKSEFDSSIFYCEKAVDIYQQLSEQSDDSVMCQKLVESLAELGKIYQKQKDFEKALDHLNQALQIALQSFGQHHFFTANIYQKVGNVYSNMGETEKAFEHFETSLSIDRHLFGDHYSPFRSL